MPFRRGNEPTTPDLLLISRRRQIAIVLADLIARMPCRSSIDRRGLVGRVLRDVRRDVEVAQTLSSHPSFSMLLTSREISRSIPHRTPGAGVFRSRIVPGAAVARRH